MSLERPPRLKTTPSTWLSQTETPQVIEKFLEHYYQTHYTTLANRAKELIEAEVSKPEWNDVHVNVRARGKEPKSLEEKLKMRHVDKPYQSEEEIWDDIHDLAGVRIILYMPSEDQREKVRKIVQAIWGEGVELKAHEGSDDRMKPEEKNAMLQTPAEERRRVPKQKKKKYRRRHLGYTAVHYRTKMKEDHHKPPDYFYKPRDRVEIQVVSALSHAWAEAGHDILYKSYAYGPPTLQEELLLDSLNGIVLSGDLLLEQFHELVMKRTFARFRHRGDFGTFLRDLDILQPEDDNERREFEMEGLDVLLRFLRKTGNDYPLALRNALKELGFPEDPQLDAYMAQNIKPHFQPAKGMLATVCLLHHMLPEREVEPPKILCPREQCSTMINALILLQAFFPRPDLANSFLKDRVTLSDSQRKSLDFVLSNCRRQLLLNKDDLLDEDSEHLLDHENDHLLDKENDHLPEKENHAAGYEEYEKKIGKSLKPAWEWFQSQAKIKRSICGIVFRLVEMGATENADWASLLGQLRIGGIISRASTGSMDGDANEREEEAREGIMFG